MALLSVGQIDSNPYNPGNWQDLPSTGSHYDTVTSWWKVGNVVHTGSETFTHVPVPVPAPPPGGIVSGWGQNTSGEAHSGKMVSSANITQRKKWIGTGPAPLKIWVVKFAFVTGTTTPNGTFTYQNQLASTGSVTTYDSTSKTVTASGSKLSEETITGDILEVSFNLGAVSIAAESTSDNYATSSCGASVTLKGAFITGPPTYRSENGFKVVNEPKDRRTDIGTVKEYYVGGGEWGGEGWGSRLNIWLGRALYQSWQNPFHDWLVVNTAYTDDLLHEYEEVPLEKNYSYAQSYANVTTAFDYLVTLKLKDVLNPEMPGGPIEEHHHVFVHAPIFKVQIQSTVRDVNWTEVARGSLNPPLVYPGSKDVYFDYALAWSNFFGFLSNVGQGGGAVTKQPWLEAVGSALGILVTDIESKAVKAEGVSFHLCYIDPTHEFLDPLPNPNPETGWEMVAGRRLLKYDNKTSRAEKYGQQGFESFVPDVSKIKAEDMTAGTFNLIGTSQYGGGSGSNSGGTGGG